MGADEQTAAGQWAALWETYMHENRSLRTRAEAAEQRAESAEAALAQAHAEGEAAGAAHERAAVVAMLLQSPDPVWAEVARCIMDGEHVAPAAGGAR
jgi:hypothetical protein